MTLSSHPVKRGRIAFDSRLSHNIKDLEFDPVRQLFFPRNPK
jgi:hypothetical protein